MSEIHFELTLQVRAGGHIIERTVRDQTTPADLHCPHFPDAVLETVIQGLAWRIKDDKELIGEIKALVERAGGGS